MLQGPTSFFYTQAVILSTDASSLYEENLEDKITAQSNSHTTDQTGWFSVSEHQLTEKLWTYIA